MRRGSNRIINEGPLDFIAGRGILFGLIFVALAALFASAGAGIAMVLKKVLLSQPDRHSQ